jgi:hypothetical protein
VFAVHPEPNETASEEMYLGPWRVRSAGVLEEFSYTYCRIYLAMTLDIVRDCTLQSRMTEGHITSSFAAPPSRTLLVEPVDGGKGCRCDGNMTDREMRRYGRDTHFFAPIIVRSAPSPFPSLPSYATPHFGTHSPTSS